MSIKTCPNCQAKWIGGQFFWSTGKIGCPHDLAGLVCNEADFDVCINPCKGSTSGQTWNLRRYYRERYNDFGTEKDDDTPYN